jgi:adenosylcobinamide kinase/adenosylcobinamide-phosphate guanylyltransferase
MKILYYGGQKSGKSYLAEKKALYLAEDNKPYYVATYNNSYNDIEMQERIEIHKQQRKENFITIEEPTNLSGVIEAKKTYLIDCISMLLLNTIDKDIEIVLTQLEDICKVESNIIFVLNDVSSGVIPIDAISRKYIDRSGIVGQKLAQLCSEVYEVKLGLDIRLK